jgi:hypothetical protein
MEKWMMNYGEPRRGQRIFHVKEVTTLKDFTG